MKTACFTVDVDCDVAWHREGKKSSVTKGKEKAFFDASREGLVELVGLLKEIGVRATFFFEARTAVELNKSIDLKQLMEGHEVGCHGLEHEDLTGVLNGVIMSREEKKNDVVKAKEILEKIFGKKMRGFRAPYLHADKELLEVLKEAGFEYDSSLVGNEATPYKTSGITEIPFLAGGNGKPALYLWKLMEGRQSAEELLENSLNTRSPIVLATHSWHLVKKTDGTRANVEENKRAVRIALEEIKRNACFKKMLELSLV